MDGDDALIDLATGAGSSWVGPVAPLVALGVISRLCPATECCPADERLCGYLEILG